MIRCIASTSTAPPASETASWFACRFRGIGVASRYPCDAGGATDADREERLLLRPVPGSAPLARRFAEKTLLAWGCADHVDTTLLLVSELVTNSVLHAGSTISLTLRGRAHAIRVEVTDTSAEAPVRPDPDVAVSGRGMAVIASLASSWGVEERSDGKAVWFEIAL
jgi:anti-sigma regulatory factor (Ser/Thr protein kinase)